MHVLFKLTVYVKVDNDFKRNADPYRNFLDNEFFDW